MVRNRESSPGATGEACAEFLAEMLTGLAHPGAVAGIVNTLLPESGGTPQGLVICRQPLQARSQTAGDSQRLPVHRMESSASQPQARPLSEWLCGFPGSSLAVPTVPERGR